MKTFRRDKLRRLIEAGRVECAGSYHFDDMLGASRDGAKGMPVAMKPADWHDMKHGVCYVGAYEFEGKCGRAWENADGTVTLYVHSNSNYDFKILPEAAKKQEPTPKQATEPSYEELKARIAELEAR